MDRDLLESIKTLSINGRDGGLMARFELDGHTYMKGIKFTPDSDNDEFAEFFKNLQEGILHRRNVSTLNG
jgi:hypothetical protein